MCRIWRRCVTCAFPTAMGESKASGRGQREEMSFCPEPYGRAQKNVYFDQPPWAKLVELGTGLASWRKGEKTSLSSCSGVPGLGSERNSLLFPPGLGCIGRNPSPAFLFAFRFPRPWARRCGPWGKRSSAGPGVRVRPQPRTCAGKCSPSPSPLFPSVEGKARRCLGTGPGRRGPRAVTAKRIPTPNQNSPRGLPGPQHHAGRSEVPRETKLKPAAVMPGDGIRAEFGRSGERTGKRQLPPSAFLSFFLFPEAGFSAKSASALAVAARLCAGSDFGPRQRRELSAVLNLPRRRWSKGAPVTCPPLLYPLLQSSLHSPILVLFRVYFLLLSFLRTRVQYTDICAYIYVSQRKKHI